MKKYVSMILFFVVFSLFTFLAPVNGACKELVSYDTNIANKTEYLGKNEIPYKKEVFLTFDDGPCINNTKKIMNILKENDVKATFFIVGRKGEENPKILKELSDNGMSIGIHTYSHNYKEMYKNVDAYMNDLNKCGDVIKKITGKDPIPFVRLPGGSDNLVASASSLKNIKNTLNIKGYKYVDWNVTSGDADSHKVPVEKIKSNVINRSKDKKISVVLMHDTYYKHFTVEALPDIIKHFKNEGFVFRTFDNLTEAEEKEMIRLGIINR